MHLKITEWSKFHIVVTARIQVAENLNNPHWEVHPWPHDVIATLLRRYCDVIATLIQRHTTSCAQWKLRSSYVWNTKFTFVYILLVQLKRSSKSFELMWIHLQDISVYQRGNTKVCCSLRERSGWRRVDLMLGQRLSRWPNIKPTRRTEVEIAWPCHLSRTGRYYHFCHEFRSDFDLGPRRSPLGIRPRFSRLLAGRSQLHIYMMSRRREKTTGLGRDSFRCPSEWWTK